MDQLEKNNAGMLRVSHFSGTQTHNDMQYKLKNKSDLQQFLRQCKKRNVLYKETAP